MASKSSQLDLFGSFPVEDRRPAKRNETKALLTHPPSFVSLPHNLALMAGAGAGKTYNLVTICLHLLGGARAGRKALTCSQLAVLTFTRFGARVGTSVPRPSTVIAR